MIDGVNVQQPTSTAEPTPPDLNPYLPPQAAVAGGEPETPDLGYAGFWVRFGASTVDMLLVVLVGLLVLAAALLVLAPLQQWGVLQLVAQVAPTLLPLLYFSLLESRESGATLGKRALGIRVRGPNGVSPGFIRALCRFLARYLSSLPLLLGYLIQPFNPRRRALHDMLTGTVVVVRRPPGAWGIAAAIVCTLLLLLIGAAFGVFVASQSVEDSLRGPRAFQEHTRAQKALATIGEHYWRTGMYPATLEDAGVTLPPPPVTYTYDSTTGRFTVLVEEEGGAPLGMVFDPVIEGRSVVHWQCRPYEDSPPELLPGACRPKPPLAK